MAKKPRHGDRIEPVFTKTGDLDPPTRAGRGKSKQTRKAPAEKPAASGKKNPDSADASVKFGKGRATRRAKTTKRKTARGAAAAPRQVRARRIRRGWTWRFLRRAAYWSAVAGLWAILIFGGVLGYYAAHLPQTSEWSVPKRPPNVRIVATNGRLLANRGDTGGEAVRLEQLPKYLPQAIVAIEDHRFYSHFGIDPIGLTRAMLVNLTNGRLIQGGSTLTQQLAKNLFLKPDRTVERKMQELVLAFWLEAKFSKNEILEMYLNRVYFGAGAYGVDAAARRYFGKSARRVTLAEAAILAGLVKAPSIYAPTRNPELARERSKYVIQAMVDTGVLPASEGERAKSSPAALVSRLASSSDNYIADWIMDKLPGYVGSLDDDIIVDTTIDLSLQHVADRVLHEALDSEGEKLRAGQGVAIVLDSVGAVRAMVGGRDYAKSQFNRAVSARRQPGSAFKPFVYLTALEQGMTPATIRTDGPISIGGWRPKNYTRKYYGNVTLKKALAYSLNTVAAQIAYEVGPSNVAETAARLGIASPLKATPSIALGTSEVTPLELTAAYVPFSNGGYGVVPHVIKSIRTESGKVLYKRSGSGPGRVVSPRHVAMMNEMLAQTLIIGTARKAAIAGWPAGGKTGTSQNFRDAWFIGYTANYTTGIWIGNDDGKPTRKATGGRLPADMFARIMADAHDGLPVADLPGVRHGAVAASGDGGADDLRPPGRIPDADAGGRREIARDRGSRVSRFLKRVFGN